MNMEKIIKGLECLAQRQEPTSNPCKGCGYISRPNFAICVKDIASDALELLKEQQKQIEQMNFIYGFVYGGQVKEIKKLVRCNECKHRDPEDHKCDCGHDIQWQLPRADDWFCADGEPKGGR